MKNDALPKHSLAWLDELSRGPIPRSRINPGITRLLTERGLAETVMMPSPFPSHRVAGHPPKMIQHLRITAAGHDAARENS